MESQTTNEPVADTAFELFSGRYRAGQLRGKRLVGNAYLSAGSDCYELKLMMLPGNTYTHRLIAGKLRFDPVEIDAWIETQPGWSLKISGNFASRRKG